jgi:hypothetical protein
MLGVSGMDADVNEALDLMLGASKIESGWADYSEEVSEKAYCSYFVGNQQA